MYSHMMVGSNDMERSKKFYDATFQAMGGKPGRADPKGRLIYMHNGSMFLVTPPIEWWHLSPIIALVAGALLLLLVGALTPQWPRSLYAGFTMVVAAVTAGLTLFQWHEVSDEAPSISTSAHAATSLGIRRTIDRSIFTSSGRSRTSWSSPA